MARNYLRKCPYCYCFFFSRVDLQSHVAAVHGRSISDVLPYNLTEEASKRPVAKFVYKYRLSKASHCEYCGSRENIYDVGVEDGSILRRCKACLTDMMERMRNVRFVRVDVNESVRGYERKIGEMDRYPSN